MKGLDIYQDIASRTNGEIYLGVVGPVRTGKSTFISKVMECLILPAVEGEEERRRIVDEMPQSGSGVVVTTSEPKFCPANAVPIDFFGVHCKIRLCDCAGYMIDGATAWGGEERKIKTMWSEEEMSFEEASEVGTRKVACEHSTIAVLVSTDGSIVGINRGSYEKAEEKVAEELKKAGRPFVILLNTKNPKSEETAKLVKNLKEKFAVGVLAKDIAEMKEEEVSEILQEISKEFKIKKIQLEIPKWMQALSEDSEVISGITRKIQTELDMEKMGETQLLEDIFSGELTVENIKSDMANGCVFARLVPKEGMFLQVLGRECDMEIQDEYQLFEILKELKTAKECYEKLQNALSEVEATGYGVVSPTIEQLELSEPELLKEGNQYGVRLHAKAPSLHIMKVEVETELRPIVGSDAQGEELAKNMMKDFEANKQGIWNTNMFGKPLSQLVRDGLNQKLSQMPTEVRSKMKKTVGRIVNEGKGGVICILL